MWEVNIMAKVKGDYWRIPISFSLVLTAAIASPAYIILLLIEDRVSA
jgi:hypothetical protein